MVPTALQIALYVLFPLVAIELARRYRVFEWINPVVLCYVAGMVLANSPVADVDVDTATLVTEASIPLAIPLILFSSDVRAWLSQSRPTVISFFCALVAVCVASFGAAHFMGAMVEESWKISGMLVGVYSGGTPNLMSIGMALEASEETFVLLNASDVIVGGIYLLFLLTLGKPLLSKFFDPYDGPITQADTDPEDEHGRFDWRGAAPHMGLAFALSAAIVGASAGLTLLVFGELAIAGVFLGLTTGGVAASLSSKIRGLRGSYELGNYFILVFCVAMGARTDFTELLSAGSTIFFYTVAVIAGALLLHFLLAKLFRIDVDTLIITSTAAVYGPAFVGPIAEAIGNRQVILSGLTAGLVGYAVGNYMGLGLAYLLHP
jgi:uncharacterized membrane protein